MKTTNLTIIKNKSNNGLPSKQVVIYLQNGILDDAILIIKMVLIDKEKDYLDYIRFGFFVAKVFKDKILMQQIFSIKISSFQSINKSLVKYLENENQCNRNR